MTDLNRVVRHKPCQLVFLSSLHSPDRHSARFQFLEFLESVQTGCLIIKIDILENLECLSMSLFIVCHDLQDLSTRLDRLSLCFLGLCLSLCRGGLQELLLSIWRLIRLSLGHSLGFFVSRLFGALLDKLFAEIFPQRPSPLTFHVHHCSSNENLLGGRI